MKKILVFALVLCTLALAMTGCSKEEAPHPHCDPRPSRRPKPPPEAPTEEPVEEEATEALHRGPRCGGY